MEDVITETIDELNDLEESEIRGLGYIEAKRGIYRRATDQALEIALRDLKTWATTRAAVTKYDLLKYIDERTT